MLSVSFRVNRVVLFICAAAAAAAAVFFAAEHSFAAQATVQEEGIRLPVIMYHSMLKEQKRLGRYVVSPTEFESDLRYLQSKGYRSVTVQDLADYVSTGRPLPAKPVMLTFDDGYYNNYTYAYPLAKKYGAKIVIAPIGYYTDLFSEKDADHPNYSHLTWDEISEMMSSGLVEFQNHSYNLHSSGGRLGAQKRRGESEQAYVAFLGKDVEKMQAAMEEHTGYRPIGFVYPFGASSPDSDAILRSMGFQATFICTEKMNCITRDPRCLFSLGRFLRPSGTSSEAYFRKIGCT